MLRTLDRRNSGFMEVSDREREIDIEVTPNLMQPYIYIYTKGRHHVRRCPTMSGHQRKDRSHFRRLRSPTSRLYRGHRRHFSLKTRRWAAIQMRIRIHQSKQAVLWPPWAASWRDKRRLPLRKRTALGIKSRSNIYISVEHLSKMENRCAEIHRNP